jgi:glycosyltransferase involved in cell wall biosynthesis
MTVRHLHVISFDIPYPPSYGGVIDVYYKIKALYKSGIKVHLHCYEYGRERSAQLKKICATVNYYPRNISRSKLFNSLPYIVTSRNSVALLKNLLKDDYPILMEGLHSCYYLGDRALSDRNITVRTHNIEHHYYQGLAQVEGNIFKRYYYYNEAAKLEQFEDILKKATFIAAISHNDFHYLNKKFPNAIHLPPFHPYERVVSKPGKGNYVLYHGNLSVGENNEAALFLVNKIFNNLNDIRLVIAGSRPSKQLKETVARRKNIILEADVPTKSINNLIRNAQINILPTFQPTGIKLKLLAALFSGRFCIANTPMVENTGLEDLCTVANSAAEMKKAVKKLFSREYKTEDVNKRSEMLKTRYSNKTNIENFLRQVLRYP